MPDPHDPDALAAAADAGDPESAHRLAVLAAMGLGLPQDWRVAMERLTQAARLGHSTAERQLALLSNGAGIDLAAWLSPPPPRRLSEGPAIFAIDGFLQQFITPIVKAVKGAAVRSFFTLQEYVSWKQAALIAAQGK